MSLECQCAEILSTLLVHYEIQEIIISPGSRNAPIIKALKANPAFNITVVVDERSAAFIALGKAAVTNRCTALVCTSGTAMLNYGPAIAEAQYRHIPLLVITADRPHESINRNEPQTIEQKNFYNKIVKKSFNADVRESTRYYNIILNEAINSSISEPAGPVHLNIEIPNPSLGVSDNFMPSISADYIDVVNPIQLLPQCVLSEISQQLMPPNKVMIIVGCYHLCKELNMAIEKLYSHGNFIILADNISNHHGQGIINNIDTIISGTDKSLLNELKPDIVITHGGPILSSLLRDLVKEWGIPHWHVGLEPHSCDTFGLITKHFNMSPLAFYDGLFSYIKQCYSKSTYAERWLNVAKNATADAIEYITNAPWCDLTAITELISMTPEDFNLHLSNGMSVRYGQVLPTKFYRMDCNRGVSGIEGSTSTAIGAASMYDKPTILISGDMSAQYDVAGLMLQNKPNTFKMAIIHNHGGGIFKVINATRDYIHVNEMMAVEGDYNVEQIAISSGFNVYHANDRNTLRTNYLKMLSDDTKPNLIIIDTSASQSADVMREFMNRNKHKHNLPE